MDSTRFPKHGRTSLDTFREPVFAGLTRNALRSISPSTIHQIRCGIRSISINSPDRDGNPVVVLGVGRGVYGLRVCAVTIEVGLDAYIAARRIVRRWSRSVAAYGVVGDRFPSTVGPRTVRARVPRVDAATGRVRYRSITRRRQLCQTGSLNGGFALMNDGPAFAAQLARAVACSYSGAAVEELGFVLGVSAVDQ